jgi:hypothetical protein
MEQTASTSTTGTPTGGSGSPSSSYSDREGNSSTVPSRTVSALSPQQGNKPGQSPSSANPTEVKINLDELAARIKGNNMALHRLAARLDENDTWNAKSLTSILDELTPLVARKDDLKLIRQCISPQLQARLGKLESGSELISDLGSKIARVRTQVEEGQFQGTNAERKAELKQLKQLSRKLASLVFSNK